MAQHLVTAAKNIICEWGGISVLFAPLMRIYESVPDDDFYLQAIAVEKELRSNGLDTFLMDAVEAQTRNKGSARRAEQRK